MEVILTHENADFDSIASLIGASKLFPSAIPVLPRRVNRNIRAFLSLYGAELPLVQPGDLRRGRITRVILVDTQGLTMLKGMRRDVPVDVIDHHERDPHLAAHWTFSGGLVGATTTLLVEEISARALKLTDVEATLLLMGIYEDTGSLSYPGTTARDIRAAAWLIEQGANLAIANEFLHHPLAPAQRALYETLLEQSETHQVEGHTIVIAWAEAPPGLDEEISTLAHKLRELLEPAALFVLVGLDGRIQLVARSSIEDIDVAHIAGHFGGGGHARASAALIRDRSLEEVRRELVAILPKCVRPGVTVGQIMSRGVQVLSPTDTIAQAAERMRRSGHEGYPVVSENQVIGLLTRRAVDRALQFDMADAPVTQVMEAGSVSVSSRDSIETLRRTMIESGWGQVPVIEDGRIIGVVTRTDLITLRGQPPQAFHRREVARRLEEALAAPTLALVRHISQQARAMGFIPYFVGGLVRDLLLGNPVVDIDLVIEGDAIALARQLAADLGGRITTHKRFGTAKWLLSQRVWRHVSGDTPQGNLPDTIDFATARSEFYAHPTALPLVASSSIKQDLHRRDFTINTLAIRLDPDHWGELLDFYGGEEDLRQGVIRVLHSLSFVDDPTRMLRAARLETRLGFRIDPRTESLLIDGLPLLKRVSGDRIRHELDEIFAEPEPERALSRLEELGVLAYIHPRLHSDAWLQSRFRTLRELDLETWGLKAHDRPFLHLALLAYRLDESDLQSLIERLRVKREDAEEMRLLTSLRSDLKTLRRLRLPSAIYRLLQPYPARVLAVAWVASEDKRLRERLLRYQTEWRLVETCITGKDLKAMGMTPGPLFGRLLAALHASRLDGKVRSRQEEEALLKKLLAMERKAQELSERPQNSRRRK